MTETDAHLPGIRQDWDIDLPVKVVSPTVDSPACNGAFVAYERTYICRVNEARRPLYYLTIGAPTHQTIRAYRAGVYCTTCNLGRTR